MKFGVSFARTTPLPTTLVRKASRSSRMCGFVYSVGISSTRCIKRGGLKKCTPQKRALSSGVNPSDNVVIDSPDVFVAKIAWSASAEDTFL
jgi:hypothetical protein